MQEIKIFITKLKCEFRAYNITHWIVKMKIKTNGS
jgi:hypothetical protein